MPLRKGGGGLDGGVGQGSETPRGRMIRERCARGLSRWDGCAFLETEEDAQRPGGYAYSTVTVLARLRG
jgi:hypothetical protein